MSKYLLESPLRMVDLKGQYEDIKEEVNKSIQDVINSTAFINGPAVQEFSDNLKTYSKANQVIPCANGTDALQIAMMALDLKPGDEVIVPAFTYIATVEVISLLNLTPVFVEVDPDSFNIDYRDLEKRITEKTKAIVVVHLFGQSAYMEPILELARKHDISIIEDNAQAIGSDYHFRDGKIKKTGTIGDIGTTSFFPSKNLGCYGDGGALFTNDTEIGNYAKSICNHGQGKKYYHDTIGVNSRLDSIQAAILNVKLKYLDTYIEKRREVAKYYDQRLGGFDDISIPFRSDFTKHVFHQYTLKLSDNIDRGALKEHLMNHEIPSMIYYPLPVHFQKAYLKYGYKSGDFPISEDLCNRVLSLPIHTQMNEGQLDYICSAIENYLN